MYYTVYSSKPVIYNNALLIEASSGRSMEIGPLLRKVDPTEPDPGVRSIVMETQRDSIFEN